MQLHVLSGFLLQRSAGDLYFTKQRTSVEGYREAAWFITGFLKYIIASGFAWRVKEYEKKCLSSSWRSHKFYPMLQHYFAAKSRANTCSGIFIAIVRPLKKIKHLACMFSGNLVKQCCFPF